jgi:hypothetical protein
LKFIRIKFFSFLYFFSSQVFAHAFDEKYDLPLPINYFLWGAAGTVALTYFLAIIFLKLPIDSFKKNETNEAKSQVFSNTKLRFLLLPIQLCFLIIVVGLLIVGLTGPQNPLMNLIPHVLWVNWWIGMPLLFIVFGNVLQLFSPIDTLFNTIALLFRKPLNPLFKYPSWLGCWPATFLLLSWCWIEVIYPNAALPRYISAIVIAWLIACVILKILFGKDCVRNHIDFFAIYFSYFGMTSAINYQEKKSSGIGFIWPFKGLIISNHSSISGSVSFIIAMLSTVLFDGLHGSNAWQYYEQFLTKYLPKLLDINGYVAGAIGVFLVWFVLYTIFLLSCAFNLILSKYFYPQIKINFQTIVKSFAPTLVPIAVAYLIAHNFSSLILQGQNFLALLSDPYQLGWDICGTADLRPDITLIDARLTWYVAISSILLGHVISIWLCHLRALKLFNSPSAAGISTLPLSLVMIIYTVISLIVLAEPLTNG